MSDLISRQAAIEALCSVDEYNARSIKAIKDLPSAQPDPRWIPVTERLPEDGIEVWVTIEGHDVIFPFDGETLEQAVERISKIRWVTRAYWSEEEQGWNDPSFGCPLVVHPIAWIPMERPEPYERSEDD